jgi:hypothetical protein
VRDSSDELEHDQGSEERGYAEWYAWARENLDADSLAAHEAAEAAIEAQRQGQDHALAVAAATRAARGTTRLAALNVPPRRRTYAEWYDWARLESGQAADRLHAAARAAVDSMEAGLGPVQAAVGARSVLGVVATGPDGRHFWKDPVRVAMLTFFCAGGPLLVAIPTLGAYWLWWNWQYFKFARRERLPGAQSFWWTLVPLYGYFAVWRTLRALSRAGGGRRLNVWLLMALLVAAAVIVVGANFVGEPALLFAAVIASSALLAAYAYMVQVAANDYLRAMYPDARAAPLTTGEVLAATLGGLVLLLVIGTLFLLG